MHPQSAISNLKSKISYLSPSRGATLIVLALLLLCLYGWDYLSFHQQPAQLAPNYVFVQVGGKVRSPGIYCFDQPVTVSQAIQRAGGLLPPLRVANQVQWTNKQANNNSRIHISADPSGIAHLGLGRMSVPTSLALGVPLNVNQASVDELALVPGINDKLADGIVTLRKSKGGFSQLEDLTGVKGIGPARVKRLQFYLSVGPKGD